MATQDYRYSLRMSEDMRARITKFWHEHELKNINVAISQLIDIGFKALDGGDIVYTPQEKQPVKDELSSSAIELAKDYDRLDSDYQVAVKSVLKALSKEQSQRADNLRTMKQE